MAQQRDVKGRFVKLGERIEKLSRANAIKMASMILQSVVTSTPVDTGHARANWQVGIGQEVNEELAQVDPSGQATITAGISTLQTQKTGETIHICNNVPYINRLNQGWSSQAPAGFIERAVNTALAAFRGWKIVK